MFTMGPPMWGGASDPYVAYLRSYLNFEDVAGTTVPVDQIPATIWLNSNPLNALVSTADKKFGNSSLQRPLQSTGGLYTTSVSSIGTQAWTCELFVKIDSTLGGTDSRFCTIGRVSDISRSVLAARRWDTGFWGIDGQVSVTTSIPSTLGVWHHIEFGWQAGTLYFFVDGILLWSGSCATIPVEQLSPDHAHGYNGDFQRGYTDNFKFYVGVCKHTSNFTPPTE